MKAKYQHHIEVLMLALHEIKGFDSICVGLVDLLLINKDDIAF